MSNAGEKFCLKWNDFESNISSSFKDIKDEKDFMDVTLACEESQVAAHKVVLSACSSFFRSVLAAKSSPALFYNKEGVEVEEVPVLYEEILDWLLHKDTRESKHKTTLSFFYLESY